MSKTSNINKMVVGLLAGLAMLFIAVIPVFAASETVYVTKTGTCYHKSGCEELSNGEIKTNLETAKNMGYEPCSKCIGSDGPSKTDSNKTDNSDSSDKTDKNDKNDKNDKTEVEEEVTATIGDEDGQSSSSKSTSSSSSKPKTSNSSSNSSNGSKILMTEKQRKAKFKSKTNPKMGTNPGNQPARAASAGFAYADFGTYNNYASKNGLGGAPIYLLGTVMDIQPVSEKDGKYSLAIMVNDCDGYQWYMRCNCAKDKYDLLKNELKGKAANIYGTYAGYSGVTNRPMMDVTVAMEIGGPSVLISLYQ